MTARRGIIGLCMLCALAFSAMAAQGANAEIKGTTAFTCKMVTKAVGTAGFSKEHCKAADAVSTEATYEHVAIAEETPTSVTGTNTGTEGEAPSKWTMKMNIAGVKFEFVSENVHLSGAVVNQKTAAGNHSIHGEAILEISEVTVLPAVLECKVKSGNIATNTLTFESEEMKLAFTPKEGVAIATYELEQCANAELNGNYELKGGFLSNELDGATVSFTHSTMTSQNTLKMRAIAVGLQGTLTLSAKDEFAGDTEYTPLSSTTVETPEVGTTAFTCKKIGPTGTFSRVHCKAGDLGIGEYSQVAIAEKTPTAVEGSNEGTVGEAASKWTLKSTQSGINVELSSTSVKLHGTMTNKKTEGGEHYIHGEGVLELAEVKVLPEAQKCKVSGGKVVTNELTFTSEKQGMKLKFQPKEGTVLAVYELEGCVEASLNGKYELKGSAVSNEPDGATMSFSHSSVTTQNTLSLRSQKAGLEGTLTLSAKDEAAGDTEYTPLSATTVST